MFFDHKKTDVRSLGNRKIVPFFSEAACVVVVFDRKAVFKEKEKEF